MLLRVVRDHAYVDLSDASLATRLDQQAQLLGAIGSAHPQTDGPPGSGIRCVLSPTNLRKIKALFPEIRRSNDAGTATAITELRTRLDAYETETHRGSRVKSAWTFGRLEPPYPLRVSPFPHQLAGVEFLRAVPCAALFGDCGTGKTYIAAVAFESLLRQQEKWVALVVCPPNIIRSAWLADIARFTDLSVTSLRILEDNPTKRRAKMKAALAEDTDVYVVNPENMRITGTDKTKERGVLGMLRRRLRQGHKLWLFIDESSKIKNRTSATYRALRHIRALADRCTIMTGTPSPNGIADLWAQFHILDDGLTLQPAFTDFRLDFQREIVLRGVKWVDSRGKERTASKWVDRPDAAAKIYQTIEPRMIRFDANRCLDLPPTRYLLRHIPLSAEQSQIYAQMEERLFAEIEGQPVTARVATARLMKLREITGGFVYDDSGVAHLIGANSAKTIELDLLLEQSIAPKIGAEINSSGPPPKAIVWAQYQPECQMLVERYRALYGARGLFGGISPLEKERAIDAFQRSDKCRLLVCHPQSAGHGLTLVQAQFAFYYALSYNYDEWFQSSRRIRRPGQNHPTTLYFLIAQGTIDEELVDCLHTKKNLSDSITDGVFRRSAFLKRGRWTSGSIELDLGGPNAAPAPSSVPAPP